MLAAGIDVFSTVNVQHLETLNDHVAELTGVRVRETVPDGVLARADEVVLIDLTPEALIARLREGKVYPQARVPAALNGFFKVENLQALREVALRQVAEDVEAKRLVRDTLDLREERLFGAPAPPIAERLLALAKLDASPSASCGAPGARPSGSAPRPRHPRRARSRRPLGGRPRAARGPAPAGLGARRAADRRGGRRRRGDRRAGRPRARDDLHPDGAPPARRGLGRLAEPVALRIVRALPDVDVRLVAERPPNKD